MSFPSIRPASAGDAEHIQLIENRADALLVDALGAPDWPPATDPRERLEGPGYVLVAEESPHLPSPVGFAHVMDADGHAHLEQLSVDPAHGRNGIGRALTLASIDEARRRGYSRMTLRTYAELPWNAPFYASCGFLESIPETPFQLRLPQVESDLGLDRYGRRIQMTVDL